MRFVTYLACATLVVRAEIAEEDDDMQFIRGLQANSTTANSTTGSSAATTSSDGAGSSMSTGAAPASVTQAASMAGNVTQPASQPAASTVAMVNNNPVTQANGGGSGSVTQANGGGTTTTTTTTMMDSAPVQDDAAAAIMASAADTTAVESVTIDSDIEGSLPFVCEMAAMAAETECAGAESDAATTSGSANGGGNGTQLRRLDGQEAKEVVANLICSAFGFTTSMSLCDSLPDNVKKLFGGLNDDEFERMQSCATSMDYADFNTTKSSTGGCVMKNDDAEKHGACFNNKGRTANQGKGGVLTFPETEACTKSLGTKQKRNFVSKVMMNLPKWKLNSTGTPIAIDATSIQSTADSKVESGATEQLQSALIVAAVVASKNDVVAALTGVDSFESMYNVTEELGISKDVMAQLQTDFVEGVDLTKLAVSETARESNANFKTAFTAVGDNANFKANFKVAVPADDGADASGASAVVVSSSVCLALLALF